MTSDFKDQFEETLRLSKEKRGREPSLVTNLHPEIGAPENIFYSVLSEKGFHLRFESVATDVHGNSLESSRALYIDDPEEKTKFLKILHEVDIPLRVMRKAYDGDPVEEMKKILEKTTADLTDDEKQALIALDMMSRAAKLRRLKVNQERAPELEREAEELGVVPLSVHSIRGIILREVDRVLVEQPDLMP